MPVSPRLCPPDGQAPASFDSTYRTETSYKKFSSFLNRSLRVSNRHSNELVQFSLIDLLKHLNVQQALLKGSAVYSWKTEQANADIDLQIFDTRESCERHPEQIIEFLKSRSGRAASHAQAMNQQNWLSKVSHQFKEGWHRLIISVGYPATKDRVTTLDLNFNNQLTVAHDTIHASKAIQFNWAQPKAMILDFWHPGLVKWLCDNQLLWFKPDIENGLGRLSLRLSKAPNAFLLQPDIAEHFARQASENNLRSICMRVMMDEYPRSRLTPCERKQLWEPVIDAAEKDGDEFLKRDLLAWSKFNNLEQLRNALESDDTRAMVLNRLGTGCQIGADFKNAIKQVINTEEEITTRLKPMIHDALGARVVPGELLFSRLDTWDRIQDVPEHELQTVFTACLNALANNGNPRISNRASHMLGWLNGDDTASLKFWIDRVPESARNDPPEHLIEPVREGMLQIMQTQGPQGLAPVLPLLENLKLSGSDWQVLTNTLASTPLKQTEATDETTPHLAIEFMMLLANNSRLLEAFIPGATVQLDAQQNPMPTQQFHTQIMALANRLQTQKVPPMLRNILVINRGDMEIRLPDMLIIASCSQRTVTASLGKIRHWIHMNSYAVLQPLPTGAGQTLQVMWRDGCMFSGQQTSLGPFNFNGMLSQIARPSSVTSITGLLRAGHLVTSKLLHGTEFHQNSWRADGLFNGHLLLKADGLEQALLSMKHGCIRDQGDSPSVWIEHHIKDHKPEHCKVSAHSRRTSAELNMPYRAANPTDKNPGVFGNPWNVEPDLNNVYSNCWFTAPPFGQLQLTTRIPWSPSEESMTGLGEVTASQAMAFKWRGEIESGRLLPNGRLFLSDQNNPVIEFDAKKTPSANIPLTLLPTMAELLGKHSNGNYRFAPKVWGKANEWPAPGFEGFVNLLPSGDCLFSGYITSTGQALGVLCEVANPQAEFFNSWTGNFQVRNTADLKQKKITLDNQIERPFAMPISNRKVLVPHGLLLLHRTSRIDNKVTQPQHQLYFCGENIDCQQIAQSKEIQYDHPDLTRYFVGIKFTQDKQPRQLDMVFNPGDGGHDFIFIRPKNYQNQSNYREIYRDSQGLQANWLLLENRHVLGEITFPSGMTYSGQVNLKNDYFKLLGKGKLSLGPLSFSGVFNEDSKVHSLVGLNPESRHWVQVYCNTNPQREFKLDEWLEIISGGELNWESDVKAHLRCRELAALKDRATAFSAK